VISEIGMPAALHFVRLPRAQQWEEPHTIRGSRARMYFLAATIRSHSALFQY
jgi:hypothetical protein